MLNVPLHLLDMKEVWIDIQIVADHSMVYALHVHGRPGEYDQSSLRKHTSWDQIVHGGSNLYLSSD